MLTQPITRNVPPVVALYRAGSGARSLNAALRRRTGRGPPPHARVQTPRRGVCTPHTPRRPLHAAPSTPPAPPRPFQSAGDPV
jgi:hypothetical protein